MIQLLAPLFRIIMIIMIMIIEFDFVTHLQLIELLLLTLRQIVVMIADPSALAQDISLCALGVFLEHPLNRLYFLILGIDPYLLLPVSVDPVSILPVAAACDKDSLSVLLAGPPLSDVFLPVGPLKHPDSLLLVLDVLASVLPAIYPRKDSPPVHQILLPLSLVGPLRGGPVILAHSLYVIPEEIAGILGAIGPQKLPLPTLLPIDVIPFVLSSVRTHLLAIPILKVIPPLSGEPSPITIEVGPLPVTLIVPPLSLVDIPIGIDEPPVSIGLSIASKPNVNRPIRPDLYSFPVFLLLAPLPDVDGLVRQDAWVLEVPSQELRSPRVRIIPELVRPQLAALVQMVLREFTQQSLHALIVKSDRHLLRPTAG